jgi:hypothetical protein
MFASLLYEAGASPAYVMAQVGHTSSALALEVYAKNMERQPDGTEALSAPRGWWMACLSGSRSVGGAGLEPATSCL